MSHRTDTANQALTAAWDVSVFTVTTFDQFACNMAEASEILTGLTGAPIRRPYAEGEVSLADLSTEYSVKLVEREPNRDSRARR